MSSAPPIRLLVVGCGGHASDVLSVVEALNDAGPDYRVIGYVDDDPDADDRRLRARGVARLGTIDDARAIGGRFVLGVGYPVPRAAVVERLRPWCDAAPALIHPLVHLPAGVTVGEGSVLLDGVRVGPMASVGRFAMLGRNVVVGHDVAVSDYVSLMPGCIVSGDVDVGVGAMVGANATILEGRSVGDWARLGAGAVLTSDLPAHATAFGVPARVRPRPL